MHCGKCTAFYIFKNIMQDSEIKAFYNTCNQLKVNVMDYAAMKGRLDIMKWLYKNTSEIITIRTMNKSAENGHFDVVEWLYENMIEWYDNKTLKCAVEGGNLDILKFLYQNRQKIFIEDIVKYYSYEYYFNEYKEQKMECDNLMIIAIQKGFLDIVIWLYNINKTNYDAIISVDDQNVVSKFREMYKEGVENHFIEYAAMSGHLEIIQWFYKQHLNNDSNLAMHFAARNGHLHIVKWLHEECNEKPSYETKYWATRNKQFEIIQYLDSIK